MKPAAFKQAETPEGLRRVIRSALILHHLGGGTNHLERAIAYGVEKQGLEDQLEALLASVREEVER